MADLIGGFENGSGQSSGDNGYLSGGEQQGQGTVNVIQKFPFASDSNATDVGDLLAPTLNFAGQQG